MAVVERNAVDVRHLRPLRRGLADADVAHSSLRTERSRDQGRRGAGAVGAGVGLVGTIAVAIAFAVATGGQFDGNDPWYLLVSQLALWVGFVGAVVVASQMNGTGSLAADFGLSWPRLKDLWLGLVGAVVGARPAATRADLYRPRRLGFRRSQCTAPRIVVGITPSGTASWVVVVLLTVVGAPVVEELFFRGLLQGASPAGSGRSRPSSSRRSSSASPTCSTRAHWPPSCSSPWLWFWGTSDTEPAELSGRHGRPCLLQCNALHIDLGAGLPLTGRARPLGNGRSRCPPQTPYPRDNLSINAGVARRLMSEVEDASRVIAKRRRGASVSGCANCSRPCIG